MTKSELAVAELVANGLTNREIAERLFVSPHTVNKHLRHVFAKLQVHSRVDLTRLSTERTSEDAVEGSTKPDSLTTQENRRPDSAARGAATLSGSERRRTQRIGRGDR
jgi:DNA-binding CsgD family transcriptional regulator